MKPLSVNIRNQKQDVRLETQIGGFFASDPNDRIRRRTPSKRLQRENGRVTYYGRIQLKF